VCRCLVPPPIRTNSTNTITQNTPAREPSPRPTFTTTTTNDREPPSSRAAAVDSRRPSLAVLQKSPRDKHESPAASESSSDESSGESEDEVRTRRMPGARRFGRFSTHKPGLRDDEDDEDDDDSPAFLPFSRDTGRNTRETAAGRDMSATLRLDQVSETQSRRKPTDRGPNFRRHAAVVSLDSSASSGGAVGSPPPGPPRRDHRTPVPPSQQRAAGVSQASPRRSASGKESSEETPSMGSSFSDLDGEFSISLQLEKKECFNVEYRCQCNTVGA
jgi:hypothetical protein